MSTIRVDTIVDSSGSGPVDFETVGSLKLGANGLVLNDSAGAAPHVHKMIDSSGAPFPSADSGAYNGLMWYDSANERINVWVPVGWRTFGASQAAGASSGPAWYGDRAVIGGGYTTTSQYNENGMDYKSITVTSATATDFGDLTTARIELFSGSDGTTGVFYGGYSQGITYKNSIDYVTIATPGNATDWGGTLSNSSSEGGSYCDGSYHVFGGSYYMQSHTNSNRIEYFTTTAGSSSTFFGNLTVTYRKRKATNDSTRGLFSGGYWYDTQSNYYNTIDYITTASTGNATDFGDLTHARWEHVSSSSTTKAFFIGGTDNSSNVNIIDTVDIQTTGNATDWGDLYASIRGMGAASDGSDYCLTTGGYSTSTINVIMRFSMTTSGNAVDWGDLVRDRWWNSSLSGD